MNFFKTGIIVLSLTLISLECSNAPSRLNLDYELIILIIPHLGVRTNYLDLLSAAMPETEAELHDYDDTRDAEIVSMVIPSDFEDLNINIYKLFCSVRRMNGNRRLIAYFNRRILVENCKALDCLDECLLQNISKKYLQGEDAESEKFCLRQILNEFSMDKTKLFLYWIKCTIDFPEIISLSSTSKTNQEMFRSILPPKKLSQIAELLEDQSEFEVLKQKFCFEVTENTTFKEFQKKYGQMVKSATLQMILNS